MQIKIHRGQVKVNNKHDMYLSFSVTKPFCGCLNRHTDMLRHKGICPNLVYNRLVLPKCGYNNNYDSSDAVGLLWDVGVSGV